MFATIEKLCEVLNKSEKGYDVDKVVKAYEFADLAHAGQNRKSGEAYITHPLAVAIILAELGMDNDCMIAALLHDVVEDTPVALEEVRKKFGGDVAILVDGVTKLGKIPYSTYEEIQAENVRKMLLAMSVDIRVMIIKLADRLHNMRTIEGLPPHKRLIKSRETMDVFAPIAHRLGIRTVKEELEDRSIRQLDPIGYKEVEQFLGEKTKDGKVLQEIISKINERIESEGKKSFISGRIKSIYGIYRKMYMQGKNIDEIYDIYAVRVIVDDVIDCYNVLGFMHDMFKPIPSRFKDYISTPKPNLYQSLHTTVIDSSGISFEIQIRSWDMHNTAEYGIAAHWKYKAGVAGRDSLESKLTWVRQLLETQNNDALELISTLKNDLIPEEVFIFTPRGDVKVLPKGSCVIDFAYAIHSGVGNKMMGAKVDGRMVNLEYQLKTGEIVEIITNNISVPNRAWTKVVKTTEARNKIRAWFKKECREENISRGKQELDSEFKRLSIKLNDTQYIEFVGNLAKRQHFDTIDDFYAAIGYDGIALSRLMPRVKEDYTQKYIKEKVSEPIIKTKPIKENRSGVIVEGIENCLVKFSQCCNPLPGDDIIGFVTRGYGVSVHKKDCENVHIGLMDEEQKARYINVRWADVTRKESFKATLVIMASGRENMLADISIALANMKLQISELNARETKDDGCAIQITTTTTGLDHLEGIINTIKKIEGVVSVSRSGK